MTFDSNSNNKFLNIRKYLSVISLLILTVALLVYFGFEQFDKQTNIDEGNLLSDLYSKTLKPIFINEQLTKEDVLNFALYNNLPIDKKENKILEVKNDPSGDEIIEIRKASIKKSTDNYSKFVDKMKLNGEQKNELDSLLEEFKQNIANTIFSDDQKTLAVDARIGILHRVLRTEIFDFISRVKVRESVAQAYTKRTLENFNKIIAQEKSKSVRNYIFITPDTVIQSEAEFIRGKSSQPVNKEEPSVFMSALKVIHQDDKSEDIVKNENDFSFKIDSNVIKVVLTETFLEDLEIDNYSELKSVLDSSSSRFEISLGVPDDDEMTFRISISGSDSSDEFQYELNLGDFGSMIIGSEEILSEPSFKDWEEFGIKMDSFAIKMHELELDTIVHPIQNIHDD